MWIMALVGGEPEIVELEAAKVEAEVKARRAAGQLVWRAESWARAAGLAEEAWKAGLAE